MGDFLVPQIYQIRILLKRVKDTMKSKFERTIFLLSYHTKSQVYGLHTGI